MSILATETIELINAQKKDIESSFTSVQEVTNYYEAKFKNNFIKVEASKLFLKNPKDNMQ